MHTRSDRVHDSIERILPLWDSMLAEASVRPTEQFVGLEHLAIALLSDPDVREQLGSGGLPARSELREVITPPDPLAKTSPPGVQRRFRVDESVIELIDTCLGDNRLQGAQAYQALVLALLREHYEIRRKLERIVDVGRLERELEHAE